MTSTQLFELAIVMLLAIIALHYLAARLGLPPSVALLVGGTLMAFLPGLPTVSFDPELVLVIFLPPLLMDGAWFMTRRHLRLHLIGIASLALGAVFFTTFVIAVVAHALFPALPWAACVALGAIVSPPDAVSVRAVLQRVKLPQRLLILLEGESLLNDASGLVLFRFAVVAATTGAFSTTAAVQSFFLLAIGGVLVGVAVGAAWVLLVRRLGDDYLIIAASTLSGWAAYLLGESLHVSGVIATVITGLICGWFQHTILSAAVRVRGTAFWMVLIFLLEAAVFMLIGFSLRGVVERAGGFGVVIDAMGVPILLILLTLTLTRFVWVFGSDVAILLGRALGLRRFKPLGPRGAVVLSWAGVRGVVSLALALSLPEGFPGRDFILMTAFAVIFATILLQGTTLRALIQWAGPTEPAYRRARLTMSHVEAAIANVQFELIKQRAYDAEGNLVHPQLLERYQRKATMLGDYPGREEHYSPGLRTHFNLVLEANAVGRAELFRLYRAGDMDDHVLHELERDLDLEELSAISAMS